MKETDLVFTAFDMKNTGKCNIYDLKDAIRDIGVGIDDDEIERMFKNADTDDDGLVTREDFYNIVTRKAIWSSMKLQSYIFHLQII